MGEVIALAAEESSAPMPWAETEMAVLGCTLWDSTALASIPELLPYHFREIGNQYIFSTMLELWAKGLNPDPLVVAEYMADNKAFNQLGGLRYLQDMAAKAPPTTLIGSYAAAVLNNWMTRELKCITSVAEGVTDGTDLLAAMYGYLARVEAHAPSRDDFEDAFTLGSKVVDKLNGVVLEETSLGLKTGLAFFDKRVGGLVPGDVTVIGGSPSMGKSSVARNILYGAAKQNPDHLFAYYSLEMSKDQLTLRAISAAAWINGEALSYAAMKAPTDATIETLARHKAGLPTNLYISEKKRVTVDDIRRSIIKLQQKHGKPVGAVVVDYLQLLTRPDNKKDNLSSIIDAMTAELKRIAGDLGVSIVLLSQLSRQFQGRDNKKPVLTDLRESGGVESNASNVLFPYREYQILKDCEPKRDEAKDAWRKKLREIRNDMTMIWGKVRDGEVGEDHVYCGMAYDLLLDSKAIAQTIWLNARGN